MDPISFRIHTILLSIALWGYIMIACYYIDDPPMLFSAYRKQKAYTQKQLDAGHTQKILPIQTEFVYKTQLETDTHLCI